MLFNTFSGLFKKTAAVYIVFCGYMSQSEPNVEVGLWMRLFFNYIPRKPFFVRIMHCQTSPLNSNISNKTKVSNIVRYCSWTRPILLIMKPQNTRVCVCVCLCSLAELFLSAGMWLLVYFIQGMIHLKRTNSTVKSAQPASDPQFSSRGSGYRGQASVRHTNSVSSHQLLLFH